LLCQKIQDDKERDKAALALLTLCKDYVYADDKKSEDENIIISFNKLMIPAFVVNQLLTPLIGKCQDAKVALMPCKYTDTCRIVDSEEKLCDEYKLTAHVLKPSYFPIIVCNSKIHNGAARDADLLIKYLELTLGKEKTPYVFKKILMNENCSLHGSLIETIYSLSGDPCYVYNFMQYIDSYTQLNAVEVSEVITIRLQYIASKPQLRSHIKEAQQNTTPGVNNQWSAFSMLVGLIEKQLGSARGSMWPASENLKPFEDDRKKIILDTAKNKHKTQLNFEELLESSRDYFNHNAVEPGKLIEVLLKDSRIWK
jgi:hypothetical protein